MSGGKTRFNLRGQRLCVHLNLGPVSTTFVARSLPLQWPIAEVIVLRPERLRWVEILTVGGHRKLWILLIWGDCYASTCSRRRSRHLATRGDTPPSSTWHPITIHEMRLCKWISRFGKRYGSFQGHRH